MIIVPLFLAGAALGAWLVWRSPARRQCRAQAQARAALQGQLFDVTELRWWSDEKVQSARVLADRLVDSAALADYVQTYDDGDEVARHIYAYQSTMAKEWTRRYPPAPPAFSRAVPAMVLVGATQRAERKPLVRVKRVGVCSYSNTFPHAARLNVSELAQIFGRFFVL